MTRAEPYYDIKVTGQVIHARMVGSWGGVVDLSYLSEMAIRMNEVRALPWAIFIDVRKCEFTEEMFKQDIRHNSGLDRRNQLIECWLLNEPNQLSFLAHFMKKQDVQLGRFLTTQDASNWMNSKGFALDVEWLEPNRS